MKKKLASLLIAVATVAMTGTAAVAYTTPVLAATATAADSESATTTYSLTIDNTAGSTAHTLELYQIFTGTYDEDTKILSNIEWGTGVTSDGQTNFGDAADYAETIATEDDAETFENALVDGSYLQNATEATVEAGSTYEFTGLTSGYYMVMDKIGSQSGENSAYTSYIIKVVGNVSQTVKLDVPTVEKKVADINDTTDSAYGAYEDSADYDIGDTIPYEITGTMPSNIADYDTYYYQFTDTMSAGIAYAGSDCTVKVDGEDVTDYFAESVTNNEDGTTTVTWTCTDLKTAYSALTSASTVIVDYNCTLDTDAVVGYEGNDNTVYLTYSNNPNGDGDGNNDDTPDTGKTPEDKNIVFTYEFVATKVDEEGNGVEGAVFTLYKVDSSYNTIGDGYSYTLSGDDNNIFTFSGLDDGTYVLKETTTPDGYNTIEDQYFTISAEHSEEADEPYLISLTASDLKYNETTDMTFTTETISDTDTNPNGTISTDVVNVLGSTLPSTGGAGTALIYVLGGALAGGVVIVKVASKKKRA